jgi:hypothetical protein
MKTNNMGIDYYAESEKYRPDKIGKSIKKLLVGEAPPSSRKTYFYVPRPISRARPVEDDNSLPATIFNHYFKKRPETKDQYIHFLLRLQEKGVFLIDICNDPIKVRGCSEGVQHIINDIPKLRGQMAERKIQVADRDIIFLLARKNYLKHIRPELPDSQYIRWKEFRISPERCNDKKYKT